MKTHVQYGHGATMKKKTKQYYPNNWRAVADTEYEYFPSMPFDIFYAHYVRNWLLPSSHECVIELHH